MLQIGNKTKNRIDFVINIPENTGFRTANVELTIKRENKNSIAYYLSLLTKLPVLNYFFDNSISSIPRDDHETVGRIEWLCGMQDCVAIIPFVVDTRGVGTKMTLRDKILLLRPAADSKNEEWANFGPFLFSLIDMNTCNITVNAFDYSESVIDLLFKIVDDT